jgi:hypothetical protein
MFEPEDLGLGQQIPPERHAFHAGYIEGVPLDLSPFKGLVECEALAATIVTLETNRERIIEENAEMLLGISQLEAAVKSAEIDLLLDPADNKDLKLALKTAINNVEIAKDRHRGVLNRIELANGEIERRQKMLPALRARERQAIIEAARLRERPALMACEENARMALVELIARRSLDVGGNPGLIDVSRIASTLFIERPLREMCWDRFVQIAGCQPS